jgi:hypothetical protein
MSTQPRSQGCVHCKTWCEGRPRGRATTGDVAPFSHLWDSCARVLRGLGSLTERTRAPGQGATRWLFTSTARRSVQRLLPGCYQSAARIAAIRARALSPSAANNVACRMRPRMASIAASTSGEVTGAIDHRSDGGWGCHRIPAPYDSPSMMPHPMTPYSGAPVFAHQHTMRSPGAGSRAVCFRPIGQATRSPSDTLSRYDSWSHSAYLS